MSNRTRTYEWNDSREVASRIMGRDHVSWIREMAAGEMPAAPFAQTLETYPEEAEAGRVVFGMDVREWMSNPAGVIHGGAVATILDSVLTLAVMTKLSPDKLCTTLDLTVHYVRPLFPPGGKITAEGIAVHVGTTIGTAEGRVHDERGRLIAHGSATLSIIEAAKLHR